MKPTCKTRANKALHATHWGFGAAEARVARPWLARRLLVGFIESSIVCQSIPPLEQAPAAPATRLLTSSTFSTAPEVA